MSTALGAEVRSSTCPHGREKHSLDSYAEADVLVLVQS